MAIKSRVGMPKIRSIIDPRAWTNQKNFGASIFSRFHVLRTPRRTRGGKTRAWVNAIVGFVRFWMHCAYYVRVPSKPWETNYMERISKQNTPRICPNSTSNMTKILLNHSPEAPEASQSDKIAFFHPRRLPKWTSWEHPEAIWGRPEHQNRIKKHQNRAPSEFT